MITEGRFYRVSGASTQFNGVSSDIVVPSFSEDVMLGGERGLRYPLPWDKLSAGNLAPSWDLDKFIPELRVASAARIASGAQWERQSGLSAWARERALSKGKPLNMEKRKQEIAHSKELNVEMERFENEGYDPANRAADPVLDEGLNILSDLVRLNGGRKLPAAKAASVPKGAVIEGLDED